jgi:hypothetical protein
MPAAIPASALAYRRQDVVETEASGLVGSNSSIGLPEGPQQDLRATDSGDDLAANTRTLPAQLLDGCGEVAHLRLEAVPTPCSGKVPSGVAWPPPGSPPAR